MELSRAKELVEQLNILHDVSHYSVEYSKNMKRAFGNCNWFIMRFKYSIPLIEANTEERFIRTVLHEIAHALTPGEHHSKVWQAKCLEIGGNGERYWTDKNTQVPQAKYFSKCPCCQKEADANRRGKLACGKCYRAGKGMHTLEWFLK